MIDKVIQGRYHLEKLLGEGGFGAVYQARDIKLERLVAIKVLNQSAKSNPDHAQRFITEAKVTSQLSHRNIPIVYEYGESEEGQLFIVTELFQGLSLEDVIDSVHLTPRQASWIINEVNEALIVAHKRGITHRDVKPPNIYLHQGPSGEEVKLLDFGIAKLNNNQSHTLTGQLFGTPYFMAPEQILGQKNISPATDMYSLGAVLFYCLTRTVPYDGDSQFMIFNKHVNSPTPQLLERNPKLNDSRLQELINHLMEKKPEDRPKDSYSAREVFTEIEYLCTQLDPEPRLTILTLAQSQQNTQISAPHEYTIDRLSQVKTPVAEKLQVPPPLALTQGLYNKPIDPIDEIITIPPLDDHWRPTAQLHVNDIIDPLADDDDTTDDIGSNSAHQTNPDLGPIHLTPQVYDSEQVTQVTTSPIESSTSSSETISNQEIARFKRELEDITGAVDWPGENRKSLSIFLALVIFGIGLWFSLSLFADDPAPTPISEQLKSIPPKVDKAIEISSTSLPLPLRDQDITTPNRMSDLEESSLALPRASHKIEEITVRSPSNVKAKIRSKKAHTASQKKSTHRRKTKSSKGKTKTKNSVKRKKRSKTRRAGHSIHANKVKSIQLRVSPRKASYLTGDKIRVIAKAVSTKGELKNHSLKYILSPLKGGSQIKSNKSYLSLQQGSWLLKACTLNQSVCSSSIKLIVYDPSSLINLDD